MASRAMTPERAVRDSRSPAPATKRPTASQYSTRKERAAITKRSGTTTKKAAKPKTAAKTSTRSTSAKASGKATRRRSPLPRVTKQSGGWALVVPLPHVKIKSIRKSAARVRKFTGAGARRLSHAPLVGMRVLSATIFFGAMAYAIFPSVVPSLRELPAVGGLFGSGGQISATFSPEVQRWSGHIARWSEEYNLDPNLMATVMQIESCGHPTIGSSAGAQGLFQVMPFHFASHETMTDPETNAMRGAGVLTDCLQRSGGDIKNALACYNGGPRQIGRPTEQWPSETQRYVVWGLGIYADAQANADSMTLDAWMRAGGAGLCSAASNITVN